MSALSASTATAAVDYHLVPPLVFGLLAVVLARIVFVDRENRRRRKAQSLRETLPLTLVAMLVAVALIVENNLNLSKAIFAGLGIGWVAVLILDTLGERLLGFFGAPKSRRSAETVEHPPASGLPQDMNDLLDKLDGD